MSLPFFFYKLIGALAVPPGLFSLLSFLLGAALLRKPRRPRCALLAFGLAGGIWFFSCGVGDRVVTAPLEERFRPDAPSPGTRAAVVVLAGGARYDASGRPTNPGTYSYQRALEGWRIARERGWPIYLSGGRGAGGVGTGTEASAMAEAIRRFDPGAPIRLEDRSRTTWENLRNLAPLLAASGIREVVLVTSAFHMPRALETARRALPGLRVRPWPVGPMVDASPLGPADFLPFSMNVSTLGLRERVGSLAYRLYAPASPISSGSRSASADAE